MHRFYDAHVILARANVALEELGHRRQVTLRGCPIVEVTYPERHLSTDLA